MYLVAATCVALRHSKHRHAVVDACRRGAAYNGYDVTFLNGVLHGKAVFYISAKTGKGVSELLDYLTQNAPVAPWMFEADEMTDMPDRLFAAEVTREKLFMNLQNELPYHLTVETTSFKETEKSIRIEQNIIVTRPAHRMIILGRGGQMIKKIGQQSRLELTKQLGKKVSLYLFVKVRENWTEDPNQYKPWGLDFNA